MLSDERADRLRAVFADHPAVRAAYVFGSVAREGEWAESALDLAIVVDEEAWTSDDTVPLITDCMDAAERDWIDLVVLNEAPLVLQFEAVRPNVLLYANSDFEHGAFVSKVMRMYWDLQPHLRWQRKAYQERRQNRAHGSSWDHPTPTPEIGYIYRVLGPGAGLLVRGVSVGYRGI